MRIAGVRVRTRPSFVLLGLLAALSVGPSLRADLPAANALVAALLAALVGAGLLASVVAHELAHALVGRRLGLPVEDIELTLLGGATALGAEPETPRAQYLVSVSGPVVNLLLGGVAGVLTLLTRTGTVPHDLAEPMFAVNTLLALYNLLPGLPLDGGQLVRAAVWRATGDKVAGLRAAGVGGLITAAGTLLLGYAELRAQQPLGVFTVLVGVFVGLQAQGAFVGASLARRLPGVVAGWLARPAYLADADLPLAEALRRAAAVGRSAVVLGTDGRPSAVLSDALLARVPSPRRPWVSLSSVTEPVTETAYLDARLGGEDLLDRMRRQPATAYVVMDQGHLVGVLQAADVALTLRGRTPA